MIEVLGTIYLVSWLISISLITWHYLYVRNQINSSEFQTLNANLQKIGLFWSQTEDNFATLEVDSIGLDHQKAKKTVVFMGVLAFASLPGLILLTVVILSSRYLVRSRLESQVFASQLASDSRLSAAVVTELVEDFKRL